MISRLTTSQKIYLLIAGVLLVVCGVFAAMRLKAPAPVPADSSPAAWSAVAPAKLHADWIAAVRRTTDGLRADSPRADFAAARTALMEVRVTAADRDAHAALILALLALERGEANAFNSLTAARHAIGL